MTCPRCYQVIRFHHVKGLCQRCYLLTVSQSKPIVGNVELAWLESLWKQPAAPHGR